MAVSKALHCVGSVAVNDTSSTGYEGISWVIDDPWGSDLSPDADGVFGTTKYVLVDLSNLLSQKLGKQMPMCATYRVKGIQVGLRNVDDFDDNDRGAYFGGTMFYHSPTAHKIDAVQAARYVEYMTELGQADGDSTFFADADQVGYSGFRFNWNADAQVSYGTGEAIGNIAGNVRGEWNLQDTLVGYNMGMGSTDKRPSNALWVRRTGQSDEMQWSCQILNALHEDSTIGTTSLLEKPERNDWVAPIEANNHLDVMGGLMLFSLSQCNTIPNGDASPDDYDLQFSIQVEGWSQW